VLLSLSLVLIVFQRYLEYDQRFYTLILTLKLSAGRVIRFAPVPFSVLLLTLLLQDHCFCSAYLLWIFDGGRRPVCAFLGQGMLLA
jgi:hypothetical protein